MDETTTCSVGELRHQAAWLEQEIDTCLSCDLPVAHLEKQLLRTYKVLNILRFQETTGAGTASATGHVPGHSLPHP